MRIGRVLDTFGLALVYAVGALVLGVVVPRMEAHYLPGLTSPVGINAAIALLSAIASGMLPLTGLVFSLAFVLVQFSATAYSPRLVAWLTGSATLRHSLGVFTGTFLYAMAALVWIDRDGNGHVPPLTLWTAIALLLASVAFFVLLVRRVSTLQIARVLAYVGDCGRDVIERDFPMLAGAEVASAEPRLQDSSQVVAHRGRPAVLQALDVRGLVALAERERAVVVLACAVGDTVVDGLPLLHVHGGARSIPEHELRRRVRLGSDRTFEQDPKYALRLLVDIAIKALSPAINDPTTAVQALDQIEDLLLRLSRRDLAAGRVRDAAGDVRLVIPVPGWEDFLMLAFDEIRYYGRDSIQVMRRMRALLQSLIANVPSTRRASVLRYQGRVDNGIHRVFADVDDRQDALAEDRQGLGLSGERRPKG